VKKAAKHLRLVLSWRENIGIGDYYIFVFLLFFVLAYILHFFLLLYDLKQDFSLIVMISFPCMLDLVFHGEAFNPSFFSSCFTWFLLHVHGTLI
jgi:hypothetical protein